ncbi:hypothetical protein TUM19329_25130 [Legionella antarctica]|uniref:Lipoprotein n=1 Tax=Legionella antarctica TaxID=2708020 RepID=A0A6F8T7Z0_9GAMM|nr:CsiV family protein [Legionella antarctica]BCA96152.1 hypothetical protein TUM19329_25130 [Legionella antarctica]
MLRLFILTISVLYSCFTLAKSNFQVDLIIFAYPQGGENNSNLPMNSLLIPISINATKLNSDSTKPYGLLSPSKSGLRDEYYILSRKSHYKVLGHYSWKQPANNQQSVVLPDIKHDGWQMQGTVRVRQSNYYLFDTDLQLSHPDNPQSSFFVSQKQRLKSGLVYFLDHPQVGMLVKVHKLA